MRVFDEVFMVTNAWKCNPLLKLNPLYLLQPPYHFYYAVTTQEQRPALLEVIKSLADADESTYVIRCLLDNGKEAFDKGLLEVAGTPTKRMALSGGIFNLGATELEFQLKLDMGLAGDMGADSCVAVVSHALFGCVLDVCTTNDDTLTDLNNTSADMMRMVGVPLADIRSEMRNREILDSDDDDESDESDDDE